MILSPEKIKELIKKPEAFDDIARASQLHCDLRLHVNGEGYKTKWLLKKAAGFESDKTLLKKKHYCRPKTPRIYQGIIKQYSKTFRAKGNFRNYKFKDGKQSLEKELKSILENVSYGLSLKQFMQDVWMRGLIEEPNGFIGVELKSADQLKDKNKEEPYLQFYCINYVHDYLYIQNELQYLILKTEIKIQDKKIDAFRVIDELTDSLWYIEGDEVKPVLVTESIINEQGEEVYVERPDSYKMKFNKIPFIQVSNYRSSVSNSNFKINPITRSLPNADSYQSLADDHTICVKLHQHPIFFSYPVTCTTCNGTKEIKRKIDEENFSSIECNTCNGTGFMSAMKADISAGISLPITDDFEENGFPAAQPPAGYV